MRLIFTLILSAFCFVCQAQYSFSGYINADEWQNTVYLSLVEDYRKTSGIYTEQIISKTNARADGFFKFTGNNLDASNRIYRIHIDKCSENQQETNHFDGLCNESKTLVFIANNTDQLELPFSFDNQVFCDIISTNSKANAFVKIDSLKSDMKFAYSEFRSQANRKLNNKKWFKTLQNFGKSLNEPLAELYIYAYLSDRTSDLHNHYLEDLKTNDYYANLKTRLISNYPTSTYISQYQNELDSDNYIINVNTKKEQFFDWKYLLIIVLIISVLLNIYFFIQTIKTKKNSAKNLKQKLSKQERVVLDLILQNKTNKDIAEELFLSVSTIKTHVNNIYKKLKVQSREETKALF